MIWLVACAGGVDSTPDAWQADVRFTVERGDLGPESIELGEATISEVDGVVTYVARDTEGVGDLMLRVLDDGSVFVRYRKGQQHLLGTWASCTLDGDVDTEMTFECADLHTETGTPDDETPWSISEGTWTGGAESTGQSELRTSSSADWGLTFATEDDTWSVADSDRTLLVGWRAEEYWVFSDDGDGLGPDDVQLRVYPSAGLFQVERLARDMVAAGVSVDLALLAESEITASLAGSDQTGTSLSVRLWDDLAEGEDEASVTIR